MNSQGKQPHSHVASQASGCLFSAHTGDEETVKPVLQ